MPYVKGVDRKQITLFPESIEEYVAFDNPVRVIDAFVGQLDLVVLGFTFALCPKIGRPPYDPGVLLNLYLYGYLNRIRSSRRLEHEAKRNLELIWLLEKQSPDFKTIADFRKNNKKALKEIFRDFNRLCKKWDLFGKETVAIDGTKFKASNSKKNNYSQKKLERHKKYIDEQIDRYLGELDENDEIEQCDRKPATEEIKKRIEELKKRKKRYEGLEEELKLSGQNEISTTDPDSRLMSNNNNTVSLSYNVQTAVDGKHSLIVDFEVTAKPNDLGQLSGMALRAKKILEVENLEVLADKGYYLSGCLQTCVENNIRPYVSKQARSNKTGDEDFYIDKFHYVLEKDLYICPAGKELKYARTRSTKSGGVTGYDYRNYEACLVCVDKARCTQSKKGRSIYRSKDQDFLDRIDLKSKEDLKKYRKRQMIVEHPFGTIKHVWDAGYYLTRGKESVSTETALSYFAYNLKRAINILGAREIVKRLKEKGKPVLV